MRKIIPFTISFIIIMLVQVLFLNEITIKSSFTLFGIPAFIPLLYPLVLILLPVNTHPVLSMTLGFFTGLIVDYFSNTPGMHAAACVLLCYVRPTLLNLFFQQNIKELGGVVPTLFKMGVSSFLVYISIAVLIHHLSYYTLQIWSFKNGLMILFKTLLSGILSVLLMLLTQLLFAKRETRRP